MLSGECRIEGIPLNGEAVLLDGLRLRLDLRLRATPKQASPAPLPLLSPAIQRVAALAGLSALIVALAVWSWSGPAERESALPGPTVAVPALSAPRVEPTPAPPPAAPSPAQNAPSVSIAEPAPSPTLPVVSPPPSAAAPVLAAPSVSAAPLKLATERATGIGTMTRIGAPLPDALPPQPLRARSPEAPAPSAALRGSVADSDLLYLFGDTK